MTAEEKEEFKREIRGDIAAAVHEELGAYKVPKEQHYQDHLFLMELRQWYSDVRSSFWKSIVAIIVMAIFALLLLGFIVWGKTNFK